MEVYFHISGLVIEAALKGKTQPGPEVWLYTCKHPAIYDGDQELFLSTRAGDTLLALDAPFKLSFGEGGDRSILDADGDGTMSVYAFKYEVDEVKGIALLKAGLCMVQHLTSQTHQNQLHIFSAQISPHMTQFAAQIAVKQSGKFGGPASTSSSSSAGMLSPAQ